MPTSHPRHSIISSLYHEGGETWGMKIKTIPATQTGEVDEGENRREKFPIAIAPQLSPPRSSLVEIFVVSLIDDGGA